MWHAAIVLVQDGGNKPEILSMERMKCAAQKTTITDECPAWQPDARQFPTVRTDLGSRALNSEMSFCTKGRRQIIALTDDDDTVKSKCWDRSWRRKFVCKGERRERENRSRMVDSYYSGVRGRGEG